MTPEKPTMTFGRHVYGLGVMALGLVGLAWGDFVLGQPVPKGFPARAALAHAAGAFMLVAGAAVACTRRCSSAIHGAIEQFPGACPTTSAVEIAGNERRSLSPTVGSRSGVCTL